MQSVLIRLQVNPLTIYLIVKHFSSINSKRSYNSNYNL